MGRWLLAVDDGRVKVDFALIRPDGTLSGHFRGPSCPGDPFAAAAYLASATRTILATSDRLPGVDQLDVVCTLAGVDFATQAAELTAELAALGLTGVFVTDDVAAVERSAGRADNTVTMVCGAGLACGIRRGAGRQLLPCLGWRTGGPAGGGIELGRQAVRAAARAADGRGPETVLLDLVLLHFRRTSMAEVAELLVLDRRAEDRVADLAPAVLECAEDGDAVSSAIVGDFAVELDTMLARARAAFAHDADWVLILGGSLFRERSNRLLTAWRARFGTTFVGIRVLVPTARPLVGTVLTGLDRLNGPMPDEATIRALTDEVPATLPP